MAAKGTLPPTLEMILQAYYPLPVQYQPPQSPQYDFPPRRSSARSLSQQPCSASRVTTVMGTEKTEGSDQNERRKIPLVQIFEEQTMEGNIKPELITLESS